MLTTGDFAIEPFYLTKKNVAPTSDRDSNYLSILYMTLFQNIKKLKRLKEIDITKDKETILIADKNICTFFTYKNNQGDTF